MPAVKELDRIAKLLRQAEGTDNAHEAEAFMDAAQRLATAASIDLAVARAHTAESEKREQPVARKVVIGETGKRGLRTYASLFLAVGKAALVTHPWVGFTLRRGPVGAGTCRRGRAWRGRPERLVSGTRTRFWSRDAASC